jgi:hypothetical protein
VTDKALIHSEEKDFRAELGRLGFDQTQFDVRYLRKAPAIDVKGAFVAEEIVTVARAQGKGHRTYVGGSGKSWTALALKDVQAGAFGPK